MKVFAKITELLSEMNERIAPFGVKFGIREEYAIEYLEQILQQYVELCNFDPASVVRGRGHHKTSEHRHFDTLTQYIERLNTNSRSTYRQTLGYNKFILRQAPLSGVFSPSRGRCRHYADRGADRQTSLSAVALQGQRCDLTELILSVDFVYRTIEN